MTFWVAGATLVGGYLGSKASGKAADASQAGADAATAEQRRQYNLTRQDYAPYRLAGYGALKTIQQLNSGNYSKFRASPDYNFVRTEGQRGLEQSAAARGGAFSGNALRALSDYNQGLASEQYGAFYNRLAGVAGIGQNATNSTAAFGANAANQIGANDIAAGDARASGIMGSAKSWTNALNTGLNAYGAYKKWW